MVGQGSDVEQSSVTARCWHSSLRVGLAATVCGLIMQLAGCASEEIRPITREEALIHIRLVDKIDYKPGMQALGMSRCANGVCVVEILRDRYPYCLDHEIRHVFEGDWHAGHESTESC
ncbi:MAG TPA: hypothetical protein DHV63_14040 [Pseudomonas sp.]|nr:hypothetical protein [Pseudomonas sp.]